MIWSDYKNRLKEVQSRCDHSETRIFLIDGDDIYFVCINCRKEFKFIPTDDRCEYYKLANHKERYWIREDEQVTA